MMIFYYCVSVIGALLLLGVPVGLIYVGMLLGYRWAKDSVAANGGLADMVVSRLEASLQRHHRRAWRRELALVAFRAALGIGLIWWVVTR